MGGSNGGPVFLDTNILAYAFGKTESLRKRTAKQLIERLAGEQPPRVGTPVLQELFVTLTRKALQPCAVREAIAQLEELSTWPLFCVDYEAIHEAAVLSRDAMISFWDALIVVAASRSGARTLYTEDLNHGREILGVRVVNPFHELTV